MTMQTVYLNIRVIHSLVQFITDIGYVTCLAKGWLPLIIFFFQKVAEDNHIHARMHREREVLLIVIRIWPPGSVTKTARNVPTRSAHCACGTLSPLLNSGYQQETVRFVHQQTLKIRRPYVITLTQFYVQYSQSSRQFSERKSWYTKRSKFILRDSCT